MKPRQELNKFLHIVMDRRLRVKGALSVGSVDILQDGFTFSGIFQESFSAVSSVVECTKKTRLGHLLRRDRAMRVVQRRKVKSLLYVAPAAGLGCFLEVGFGLTCEAE